MAGRERPYSTNLVWYQEEHIDIEALEETEAHMLHGERIHAVNFEAWDVVTTCVECAALGASPLRRTHACIPKYLDISDVPKQHSM